jgi:hypothetical protein
MQTNDLARRLRLVIAPPSANVSPCDGTSPLFVLTGSSPLITGG